MEFICRETTTYKTKDWFEEISKLFNIDDIRTAYLNYNTQSLTDYDAPKEKAPLQMFGVTSADENIAIYIFCATAGYYGSGPQLSYELIKEAGFEVTYADIVNNNNNISNLSFSK